LLSQTTSTQLVNAYRALVEIVQEDPSAERVTDPKAVRERQFMEYYLDDDVRSARSMVMKRRIIDGSRQFLEKL
jgi:nuclear pore complex protein Nup93